MRVTKGVKKSRNANTIEAAIVGIPLEEEIGLTKGSKYAL